MVMIPEHRKHQFKFLNTVKKTVKKSESIPDWLAIVIIFSVHVISYILVVAAVILCFSYLAHRFGVGNVTILGLLLVSFVCYLYSLKYKYYRHENIVPIDNEGNIRETIECYYVDGIGDKSEIRRRDEVHTETDVTADFEEYIEKIRKELDPGQYKIRAYDSSQSRIIQSETIIIEEV